MSVDALVNNPGRTRTAQKNGWRRPSDRTRLRQGFGYFACRVAAVFGTRDLPEFLLSVVLIVMSGSSLQVVVSRALALGRRAPLPTVVGNAEEGQTTRIGRGEADARLLASRSPRGTALPG